MRQDATVIPKYKFWLAKTNSSLIVCVSSSFHVSSLMRCGFHPCMYHLRSAAVLWVVHASRTTLLIASQLQMSLDGTSKNVWLLLLGLSSSITCSSCQSLQATNCLSQRACSQCISRCYLKSWAPSPRNSQPPSHAAPQWGVQHFSRALPCPAHSPILGVFGKRRAAKQPPL